MAFTMFNVLCVALVVATYVAAEGHDCKCKPKQEYRREEGASMKKCYEKVTKETLENLDMKEFKSKLMALKEEDQLEFVICMAIENKMISEDESTFDLDVALAGIDKMDIDEETSEKIKQELTTCAGKSTNGREFAACAGVKVRAICQA